MSDIVLHDLHPSPNNIKVRLALGYKRIEHELVPVDPLDRSNLIEISGQPLSPVLVHGDVVVFDSSAILRYLEANVAREPRIFAAERETMQAIEGWEQRTRGGGFGAPVGMMFGQFFAAKKDPALIAQANALLDQRCVEIDAALDGKEYLVADRLTAADLCIVPLLYCGCQTDESLAGMPAESIPLFFKEHLRIDPRHERTLDYVARVMAHD